MTLYEKATYALPQFSRLPVASNVFLCVNSLVMLQINAVHKRERRTGVGNNRQFAILRGVRKCKITRYERTRCKKCKQCHHHHHHQPYTQETESGAFRVERKRDIKSVSKCSHRKHFSRVNATIIFLVCSTSSWNQDSRVFQLVYGSLWYTRLIQSISRSIHNFHSDIIYKKLHNLNSNTLEGLISRVKHKSFNGLNKIINLFSYFYKNVAGLAGLPKIDSRDRVDLVIPSVILEGEQLTMYCQFNVDKNSSIYTVSW